MKRHPFYAAGSSLQDLIKLALAAGKNSPTKLLIFISAKPDSYVRSKPEWKTHVYMCEPCSSKERKVSRPIGCPLPRWRKRRICSHLQFYLLYVAPNSNASANYMNAEKRATYIMVISGTCPFTELRFVLAITCRPVNGPIMHSLLIATNIAWIPRLLSIPIL